MNKILITGGAGYIGSHTAIILIEQGYEIVIVDNLSNSKISVFERIKKITGIMPKYKIFDITDKQKLLDFFNTNAINSIIHFAAYKAVGESVEQPLKYYKNNLLGLINLLECCVEYNVENFVFSSSCTVYGQPDILPVTEKTTVGKMESPYGNTKLISEQILKDFINSGKTLKITALRYFNPIGAHPTGIIGELPTGIPNNLVPYITQTAIGIREELKIFGNDYDTPDGTCIRDFIDVNDLALAHLDAIKYLQKIETDSHYDFFNVGTGNGVSVKQLVDLFINSTGINLKHKYTDRRAGDVAKIWADTTLANIKLGWKAQTPLNETLMNAWKWEKYLRDLRV